jgi:hypothetical protein
VNLEDEGPLSVSWTICDGFLRSIRTTSGGAEKWLRTATAQLFFEIDGAVSMWVPMVSGRAGPVSGAK